MDGYNSLINGDEVITENGYPNEEKYQGLPDSPEIDDITANSNKKIPANYYDQYIGTEVVLSDWKG